MSEVVVVAVAKCKEGEQERMRTVMSEVAAASIEEEGCISYVIHVDKNEANRLVVVERWASQEALDTHFTLPHTQQVAQNIDALAEPPQIYFCEVLPA